MVTFGIATVLAKFTNQIQIGVVAEGIRDKVIVDSSIPGYEMLEMLQVDDQVQVEVEKVAPRFSRRASERATIKVVRITPRGVIDHHVPPESIIAN